VAFDTGRDEVLWWDTMIPKEGCRCLVIDEEYGRLYALSYPRDHLIAYDLESQRTTDLGRIGSVNSQALFIDRAHRVWATDDCGHLVRYDPAGGRLERSPSVLPHDVRYQTGWHNVFYDVAASCDRECVYASMWIPHPRLIRIWPLEGEWGRVEDLGPATQERDLSLPMSMSLDHCGGLTFAADGQLYYCASRWPDPARDLYTVTGYDKEGVLWLLDPRTLERREVALLRTPERSAHYISRGAVDHRGDLFLGVSGHEPGRRPGLFKVEMPQSCKRAGARLPLRTWG
jgi:hypothetical protein